MKMSSQRSSDIMVMDWPPKSHYGEFSLQEQSKKIDVHFQRIRTKICEYKRTIARLKTINRELIYRIIDVDEKNDALESLVLKEKKKKEEKKQHVEEKTKRRKSTEMKIKKKVKETI